MQDITSLLSRTSDLTDALRKATPGRSLYIPGGDYTISEPVTLDSAFIRADKDAIITYTGPRTLGQAAITLTDSLNLTPEIEGGRWQGPGGKTWGVKSAQTDLFRFECKGKLIDVVAWDWDSACVDASPLGHVELHRCRLGDNYYAVYIEAGQGGPQCHHCSFVGNAMAAIGMAPTKGVSAGVFTYTEMAESPYAVYQEPIAGDLLTADSEFLVATQFIGCSFEQTWYSILHSGVQSWDGARGRGIIKDVSLTDCSMTWKDSLPANLPGASRDFAVSADYGVGFITISGPSVNAIQPGGKGLVSINKTFAALYVDGVNRTASIVVGHAAVATDPVQVTAAQAAPDAPP